MSIVNFENMKSRASKFRFNSLEYLSPEHIAGYQLLKDDNEGIIVFGFKKDAETHEIHWAANDYSVILSAVSDCGKTVLVPFVPNEWKGALEQFGFDEYGIYRDYWVEDILACLCPVTDYSMISSSEYNRASEITMECRQQSRGFHGEHMEFFRDWVEGNQQDAMEVSARDCTILVNRDENGIVNGIACVAVYGHDKKKGPVVWIREVAVSPASQNCGIGKKLILQSLQYGYEHGAKRAFLMADDCNRNAINLYKSIGFITNTNEAQIDMIYTVE